MGTTQTAEEVKQEHIEKLGPELGNIYHQLRNELIFIHLKWCEFEELLCLGSCPHELKAKDCEDTNHGDRFTYPAHKHSCVSPCHAYGQAFGVRRSLSKGVD